MHLNCIKAACTLFDNIGPGTGGHSAQQLFTKTLRIMKLTAVLLLVFFLHASAIGLSQNVVLKVRNAPLSEAFARLKTQSGYYFVCTNDLLRQAGRVTIDMENEPLFAVLDSLLSPLSLQYRADGKFITIRPADIPVAAVQTPVTGTVKTAEGSPIPNINIVIKGKKTGTVTDAEGNFSLNASPGDVLVFSGIGFTTQEIVLKAKMRLAIVLAAASNDLNEVVVSGYSSQSRKDFTGSASRVSTAQIENRPVQSFEQALAGQAPGVSITQPNGVLNNTPVFRIRGINSISLSSYPLIIIDGVAAYTGSFGTKASNNPLADINPSDIESIDILKDASATAIYGSRASNGVLVITTKRGKQGKTKVNVDGWVGFSNAVRLPKMLNAEQYVAIKNEGLANAGQAPGFFLQKRADGSIVQTNWYDIGYHTGVSQNYNISFSGASASTSYFVSAGYSNQEGIIRTNTFGRKSLSLNLDHKLIKNVNVGINMTYTNTLNKSPSTGSLPGQSFQIDGVARAVMMLTPNVSPYNEDGSYNMNGGTIGNGANTIGSAYYNEAEILDHDYFHSESNTLIGNVYAQWEIVKGLKAKTSYSSNRILTENVSFYGPLQGIGYQNNGLADNLFSTDLRTDWTSTLNYTTSFSGVHNLSILGGYEQVRTTVNQWGAERTNLTDPSFSNYQGGFSQIYPDGNITGGNNLLSYFSNLSYDYKKRYLLSGSYRRDGYSGLSKGNKYGNFAGGSVGWNIAEENFFKSSRLSRTVSDLKIRGSYGTVGNINLGDFPALSLYATGLYGDLPTLYSSQAGNTALKWETSKKTDIGVDFSLWNNRISIQADYYRNNIDNMVLNALQAPSQGIPNNSIETNIGSMYNTGLEFNIVAHILDGKGLKWTAGFNLSTLKNRVTALADNNADILGNNDNTSGAVELASITRVGYSVGSIFAARTPGINPDNGQRIYLNRNNEKVQYNPLGAQWTYLDGTAASPIDGVLDAVVLGNALPTYYGGFNNTLSYKGFDADLTISYSGGNKIYYGTGATLLDGRYHNNSVKIFDRWTTPGQKTDVAKIIYGDNTSNGGSLSHSGNVKSGNFVKLRNASIGYRLPERLLSRLGVGSVRIYAQGSNLLTVTHYPGSDPEVAVNGNDSSAPGADKNSAPSARSFTFGINVGL